MEASRCSLWGSVWGWMGEGRQPRDVVGVVTRMFQDGVGAEAGWGTEEEPAQTETRQQLCLGAISFWPFTLPTSSSEAAPGPVFSQGGPRTHLPEA